MRLLWEYLKHQKKLLILALVLATVNQFFSLLDPQIFRYLIDNYANRANELTGNEFFRGVLLLSLATVGVALVSRTAKAFQDYFVNVIIQKIGTKMYADSVDHSFSLPYSVFEDQRSGEHLQKLQRARNDSQLLIQQSINVLFLSFVGILFVLAYAFYVHWIIGLVYAVMVPTLGIVTFYISRGIKTQQEKIVSQTQDLAGATTETLRNVELVKSLGLEKQEIGRLNKVNDEILNLELKKVKLVRTLSFIQGTVINALRSALTLLMLWLIFEGMISLGEFFSLLFYSFFIFNPLSEAGNVATKFYETKASMAELQKVLDTPPAPVAENPVEINEIKQISFKDVSFNYASGDLPALKNISLTIHEGQRIAFVGPSGSGKTTLIKLLLGLYEPKQGQIQYDGIESTQIDWQKLRQRIGLVSQDTQLFSGTIRDNLLFVAPWAKDDECIQALHDASAQTLLDRGNAKGLDTKIGEGGLKLSGGEKQRLSIARALLRQPEVLIFDEATSSLDSITEKEITSTIEKITKSRPSLISISIAHRLSTIADVDKIYVLEKGHLLESGTHSELLQNSDLYSALWRQQQAEK